MAGLLKSYSKYQIEKKRFTVDYSCWLEDTETLTNFTVVVSPNTPQAPLSTYGAYADASSKKITLYMGGGVVGQLYRVSLITETNQGQKKRDDIGMRVT